MQLQNPLNNPQQTFFNPYLCPADLGPIITLGKYCHLYSHRLLFWPDLDLLFGTYLAVLDPAWITTCYGASTLSFLFTIVFNKSSANGAEHKIAWRLDTLTWSNGVRSCLMWFLGGLLWSDGVWSHLIWSEFLFICLCSNSKNFKLRKTIWIFQTRICQANIKNHLYKLTVLRSPKGTW